MYFMMYIIYVIISNKTPIFRYCVPLVVRVTLQQILKHKIITINQ